MDWQYVSQGAIGGVLLLGLPGCENDRLERGQRVILVGAKGAPVTLENIAISKLVDVKDETGEAADTSIPVPTGTHATVIRDEAGTQADRPITVILSDLPFVGILGEVKRSHLNAPSLVGWVEELVLVVLAGGCAVLWRFPKPVRDFFCEPEGK